MSEMTVYAKMTATPASLFEVLKNEIGIKTHCLPFAVKAIAALKDLGSLNQREALNAANVFLDNLQTLNQGGITAEDYDKIDFVKRGKAVTISARVEAFLRAAARKGYRINDTIVAVPKEDANTTYFAEHFANNDIVYTLEDRRYQADRDITAERLVNGYFKKVICRLDVTEVHSNKRVLMTVCEISADEIIDISKASDNGIYKAKWVAYTDQYGKQRKRRVISDELNTDSFWCKWTGEMVKKTVIRRALKRVREILPELKETIYAFDRDDEPVQESLPPIGDIVIPMEEPAVDLEKLTAEQQADVKETLDLFKANPKLAEVEAEKIKKAFETGNRQEVINEHYASIMNIMRSKKLKPLIENYVNEVPKNET